MTSKMSMSDEESRGFMDIETLGNSGSTPSKQDVKRDAPSQSTPPQDNKEAEGGKKKKKGFFSSDKSDKGKAKPSVRPDKGKGETEFIYDNCEICRLDVTKLGYKRHSELPRHKAMVKVFKAVYERTERHLERVQVDDEGDFEIGGKFCDNCERVIEEDSMSKHKKSKSHIDYAKIQELLEEFIQVIIEQKPVTAKTGDRSMKL